VQRPRGGGGAASSWGGPSALETVLHVCAVRYSCPPSLALMPHLGRRLTCHTRHTRTRSWAGKSSDINFYLNSHHIDVHNWMVSHMAHPTRVTALAATGACVRGCCGRRAWMLGASS
jgi:hypothetical protein